MLTQLRRLLFGAPRPGPRMTREEVEALADRAAQAARISHAMTLISVRRVDGRIIWNAGTPTVGSGWFIEIDDATGDAGPVKHWGLR